jgi:hypothetical protein
LRLEELALLRELQLLDQWNVLRDGLDGAFYWNPSALCTRAKSMPADSKLDPATHIIYTPRQNLLRIALAKFVRQNLSQKDWDAFVEAFGIPAPIVTMPPVTTSTPTAETSAAYLNVQVQDGDPEPFTTERISEIVFDPGS